jgi:hypothetical protein
MVLTATLDPQATGTRANTAVVIPGGAVDPVGSVKLTGS